MVGVPGRSKGCNTCIQRKIKCDQGQPTCANCHKSNRICTGYRRPVAFVMSSKVTLAEPSGTDDPPSANIVTHGRWRKQQQRKLVHTPSRDLLMTSILPDSAVAAWQEDALHFSHEQPAAGAGLLHSWDASAQTAAPTPRKGRKCRTRTPDASSLSPPSSSSLLSTASSPLTVPSPHATPFQGALDSAFNSLMKPVSSNSAWREQLYPIFLDLHFPAEIPSVLNTNSRTNISPSLGDPSWFTTKRPMTWFVQMQYNTAAQMASPALESALTAICMARIGRKAKNPALVRHSLGVYTESLQQLNRAIANPTERCTDATLAASVALAMYEVAECPTKRPLGYSNHHSGSLALLELRGPDAHIGPLGHSLLSSLRFQNFIYAILFRKSNFLSQPEWLERPWKETKKTPYDHLLDHMYGIPVLLEETDTLHLQPATTDEQKRARIWAYKSILARYHAIYESMQRWYRNIESVSSGPLYWPELSTLSCSLFEGDEEQELPEVNVLDEEHEDGGGKKSRTRRSKAQATLLATPQGRGKPFPVAFHFVAFPIGQSLVLYWLVCLMAHSQIASLNRRIGQLEVGLADSPSSSGSQGDFSDLGDPNDNDKDTVPRLHRVAVASQIVRTMAYNICQSIEYFLQDSMGDVGPMSMLLPLSVVRYILVRMPSPRPCPPGPADRPGEHSDEVLWVDFLFHKIGEMGHHIAYFLDAK